MKDEEVRWIKCEEGKRGEDGEVPIRIHTPIHENEKRKGATMQMVREAYSSGHLLRTTHARDTTPHSTRTQRSSDGDGSLNALPGPRRVKVAQGLFIFF